MVMGKYVLCALYSTCATNKNGNMFCGDGDP